MNKDQFLYRKWHLKVTETVSHMQGNPDLFRALEVGECVWDRFLTAGHLHVCVHQENLQSCSVSSQRVPGWLKKGLNDNATLIPQVVLEWAASKSVLQFTTSSPLWALAAGVSRQVQFGAVKSWEKGTDRFRTVHSTEKLKQPSTLETNDQSAQNIAEFTENLQLRQPWTKLLPIFPQTPHATAQ